MQLTVGLVIISGMILETMLVVDDGFPKNLLVYTKTYKNRLSAFAICVGEKAIFSD